MENVMYSENLQKYHRQLVIKQTHQFSKSGGKKFNYSTNTLKHQFTKKLMKFWVCNCLTELLKYTNIK